MRVGFVGLGNVGGKLAGTLLRNGEDVSVMDLDPEKVAAFTALGAGQASSYGALMADCDVVITCLPRPDISAMVVEGPGGLLEAMSPGKIWLEMSTTDAAEVTRLGEKITAAGGTVDGPLPGE